MSDKSAIEWTDATWNPVTGCTKVSPGCDHCYAETFAERFRGVPGHHFEQGFDLTLRPERLDQPLRWRRPRRIFVNSMSDLFHEGITPEYIAQVFAVMARAEHHVFQLLTKRHGRMRSLISGDLYDLMVRALVDDDGTAPKGLRWPLPNVWLGVSVEDQRWADIRIPALLDTPAAIRWISAEPLLGPVDLADWMPAGHCRWRCSGCRRYYAGDYRPDCPGCERLTHWSGSHVGNGRPNGQPLSWVVVGGESGPGARPMRPNWARSLRDQCQAASVPFLLKQWGAHDVTGQRIGKKAAGRELDGRTWDEYPGGAS